MNEVAIHGERAYEGLVEEIITTLQEGRARAIASGRRATVHDLPRGRTRHHHPAHYLGSAHPRRAGRTEFSVSDM